MKIFMDTCALLDAQEEAFKNTNDKFYISNITINELENIKTSGTKDDETKYKARKMLRLLEENQNKYEIVLINTDILDHLIKAYKLPNTADTQIISCAYQKHLIEDIVFYTKDLACKTIAKSIELSTIWRTGEIEEEYTGYAIAMLSDSELAEFYQDLKLNKNNYFLLNNQYLLIQDTKENILDKYKWTEENGYVKIPFYHFNSKMFGDIKPYNNDPYQHIAMDSLSTNQLTLLGGPAGSGKTFLALSYLFSEFEKGKIDRIIIFCNPVGARNAARLGFYKGTVEEKLLATQVGHVLSSKLGSSTEVEKMMSDGFLQIIPVVDARGYEVPPYSGVYVLEAQNLTSDLLRLILQRTGKDSKIIIDGDRAEQLDMAIYSSDNGMKKMSEVFRGSELYGQVDLVNIYRSRIAELAEKMK